MKSDPKIRASMNLRSEAASACNAVERDGIISGWREKFYKAESFGIVSMAWLRGSSDERILLKYIMLESDGSGEGPEMVLLGETASQVACTATEMARVLEDGKI